MVTLENYRVHVRNEHTGEIRILQVPAGYGVDAQVAALTELFKVEGWRKATALHAELSESYGPTSE